MDEHLNAPERIVKVIKDVENVNEGTVWDGHLYTMARAHGEYARTIVTSSLTSLPFIKSFSLSLSHLCPCIKRCSRFEGFHLIATVMMF